MFTMTVAFGEIVDYLLLHLPFLKPGKIVGILFKMLHILSNLKQVLNQM